MRQIGTLADEAQARRIVDYLVAQSVDSVMRKSSDGWGVWVINEDRVETARREWEAFVADPDAARYQQAVKPAHERRREQKRAERAHARNTIELAGRLNTVSIARCPVMHGLIAISLAVAMYSGFGSRYQALMPFYFSPPVVTLEPRPGADGQPTGRVYLQLRSAGLEPISKGQLWRLFTPMFIHYGPVHLIFNMIALYWFGGLIELRKGHWVLLGLVMLASPASFFAQYLWDFQQFGLERPSLPGGMSGVNYALFGYAWMRGEYEPESGLKLANSTVLWMLMWLAVCMTDALGPIANAAHAGGLAFGMGVGLAPFLVGRTSRS